MLSFLEDDPALLEEPLSSAIKTPQEEELTMAQKLHTRPESAPKPESVQKPETARKGPKKPLPPENDPGTVTAALAPLSAPAWHFDSKMPLVRGSAPDTPAPPKVPSI